MSWLVYRLTGSTVLLGVVGFVSQIPTFLASRKSVLGLGRIIAAAAGIFGVGIADRLAATFRDICRSQRITVILVTHDLRLATCCTWCSRSGVPWR